jgi:DNA-binding transcriptional LysR family regulator
MNQLLSMRVFVRVIDTGSFTKAAESLHLPRSTASKLVNELERHLGVMLVRRTTRTISATVEGVKYYDEAARILADIDAIDHAVRGDKLKPKGHLRIDAPVSFANGLLIPALPDFNAMYPDVSIALGINDRTVNVVGEGVDCAIRAGALNDMNLIGRKIAEFEYVTCASPGYLARRGSPASPSELEYAHDIAGYFYAATGKINGLVFEKDGARHLIERCLFSTNEGNGLIELMRNGLGIGQHLRRFVQPYLSSGELVEVLPDWKRPSMDMHAIYVANRQQNARLKVFIDWLIARFGDSPDHR